MKLADFDIDGWELEDGEVRHAEAPTTFEIPSLDDRQSLRTGQIVKLMFRITVRNADVGRTEGFERMWVIVNGREGEYYSGILDNDPYCTDEIKCGLPVVFEARHVIQIAADNN